MPAKIPPSLLRVRYYDAAQAYLRSLPLEHFMEATPQATQREITLESLALVRARRSDFHLFNELLVQYPVKGQKKPGQVVPDNMVVLYEGELKPVGSYDVPLEPAAPFWMLEYVSKNNKRKDYDDNFDKYEQQLKVPYYLLFQPDVQELTLYRHNGRRYVSVKPNEHGRLAIPKLELEVALLDEWVRFWYRGELLPLPAEWQQQLDTERQARLAAEQRSDAAEQARLAAEQRSDAAEQARLAAEQRTEAERQARLASEQESARLRAELEILKQRRNPKG
jgi:Uma2 family endonuclease